MREQISERDAEMLVMLHQDATRAEVAARYGLTRATIDHHVKRLESITLDQALDRLADLTRIDIALTARRWAKALSEAPTDKLRARDLSDLQQAMIRTPTAPTPAKTPKSAKKPANTGKSPKLFKV